MLEIQCPKCKQRYRWSEARADEKVQCARPLCKHTFVARTSILAAGERDSPPACKPEETIGHPESDGGTPSGSPSSRVSAPAAGTAAGATPQAPSAQQLLIAVPLEPVRVVCPNPQCGTTLEVPASRNQLQVTCPACGMSLIVPAAAGNLAPASALSQTGGAEETAPRQTPREPSAVPCETVFPVVDSSTSHGVAVDPQYGRTLTVPPEVNSPLERVLQAAVDATDLRKLGFTMLGWSIIAAVVYLFLILLQNRMEHGSPASVKWLLALAGHVVVGLLGVVAGGVAFLAHQEQRSRTASVTEAIVFCIWQLVPLFVGTAAAVLLVELLLIAGNGLIHELAQSGRAGSLVSAWLFLPQWLANTVLAAIALVTVLLPCAVAVEEGKSVVAIGRFVTCLHRHCRSLLAHVIATVTLGVVPVLLLFYLSYVAVLVTAYSNGPNVAVALMNALAGALPDEVSPFPDDVGLPPGLPSPDERARQEGLRPPAGDDVRLFSLLIGVLALWAYPTAFVVCAFTRYYESEQASLAEGGGWRTRLKRTVPPRLSGGTRPPPLPPTNRV